MKQCPACGIEKDEAAFTTNQARCRECHNARNRERRANDPAYTQLHRKSNQRWRGSLTKPEACSKCGATSRIDGHHEDYNKPLEVVWLCAACHAERHRQMAEVAA